MVAEKGAYAIPAPIVNWVITGVVSLVLLGGSASILWAINDASWKGAVANRLDNIEKSTARFEGHLDGHPGRIEHRTNELSARVDKLEVKVNALGSQ